MDTAFVEKKQSHIPHHLISWFITVSIIAITFVGMEILKVTVFKSVSSAYYPGVTYTATPTVSK